MGLPNRSVASPDGVGPPVACSARAVKARIAIAAAFVIYNDGLLVTKAERLMEFVVHGQSGANFGFAGDSVCKCAVSESARCVNYRRQGKQCDAKAEMDVWPAIRVASQLHLHLP